MSQTSSTEIPEGEEGARRLIIKACDMCRKKKIRCEPTADTCVQCKKYRTLCRFTPISVRRKPRKPSEQKRVEELENRLKSMEEQFQRANQSKDVVKIVNGRETLDHLLEEGLSNFEWRVSLESPKSTNIPDYIPTLGPMREHRFSTSLDWNLTAFSNNFTRRAFKPLPPKQEAIILVNKAFEGFNLAFPIFDESSATMVLNYPEGGHQDPSHWACLNVVLALAHRFQSMRTLNNQIDDREALGYLQNALAVAPELAMFHPKLTSVQALLGMAIVVQGTPNPRPFSTLISQAIRMAQSLGLHRKNQDPSLTAREIEQRKRVFWIAYFLDKEHCLRTGQPPAQDEDEMDVELPSEVMLDNTIQFGDSPDVNYFNLRVKLALIQGQVYKRLISVKAEKQSLTRRMVEVKKLEGMLAVWRARVPIVFGENYNMPVKGTFVPPIIHKFILRTTYFITLNTIHRFSVPIEQWRSDLEKTSDPSVAANHAPPPPIVCLNEARNAIKLINITPEGDYACIWLILHVFVSAANLLLENILSNPTQHRVHSDLELIEPLLTLLSALAKGGTNEEVATMYQTCCQMFEKTSKVVQGASAAERGEQRKIMGKENGKETLEEFIRRIESVSAGYEDEDDIMMQDVQPEQSGKDHDMKLGFPYLGANDTRISREVW